MNYTDFEIEARTIMLKKRITMTVLAQHLGISVSYVSDILRGGRRGVNYRDKIMEFLNSDEKGCVNNAASR